MSETSLSECDAASVVQPLGEMERWCKTEIQVYKCRFTWSIQNFSHCRHDTGESLVSTQFFTGKKELSWCLRLFARGKDEESRDWVSLYLENLSDLEDTMLAIGKFWILDFEGNPANEETFEHNFKKEAFSFGNAKFVERSALLDVRGRLLPDDTLTVYCSLEVSYDEVVASGEHRKVPPLPHFRAERASRTGFLAKDFGAMLKDKAYTDIILRSGSEDFPAHKSILAARSSVLADLIYKKPSVDKDNVNSSNYLLMDDVNAEALRAMLRYIYTGRVNRLSTKLTADLMKAARRYRLQGLDAICRGRLIENLTVKSAPHILLISDVEGDTELKNRVLRFFNEHALEMMNCSSLKTVLQQRTQLFGEVLAMLSTLLLPEAK